LDTGRADYEQLKNALVAGDHEQVARSAHTISGASGNLGLMDVHGLAKRIELAAIDQNLGALDGDVASLETHFNDIAQFVNA
jgi:HPt (histidine-containing phosphotransfer) domain-containing protein